MTTKETWPVDLIKARANHPDQRDTEVLLRSAGLSLADCAVWFAAEPEPGRTVVDHVRQILVWQRRFDDAATAKEWYESTLCIDDALAWQAAGFSPEDARDIQARILLAALSADAADIVSEAAWRASGLPPAWIRACLDAGIADVATARHLFDLRLP